MNFTLQPWFIWTVFTSPIWLTFISIALRFLFPRSKIIYYIRQYLFFLATHTTVITIIVALPIKNTDSVWALLFQSTFTAILAVSHVITLAASIYLIAKNYWNKDSQAYLIIWLIFAVSLVATTLGAGIITSIVMFTQHLADKVRFITSKG